ncbi:MAG: DegT/DnrJ/EryC1/StrS family aminotransferase [Phycisphaerae bacterium]
MNSTATPVSAAASSANIPVPPLNLSGNFKHVRDEVLAEITAICDSGFYILGPKVQAFEDAFAKYCGCKHALGLSSGTDAILVALMTLGIGPGDEVIVPTFTFFATAGCVARVGATPVFCDIDPDSYNIDVAQFERLITPRTKAVMPVSLYGRVAGMSDLMSIARKRGIRVIEDACQSIGARESKSSPMAGTFGDFGATSFYPTKNLGAAGDAGALLMNDTALFEKAKQMRLHGETQRYHHQFIGGNFRIDALQAAILTIKLKHLPQWTELRREKACKYYGLFEQAGLAPESIHLPQAGDGYHVYHQFVIRAPRRDDLVKHLAARQIGYGIYYPIPLHMQECFAYLGRKAGEFPHAEAAAREVLALPMYPELTDAQQAAVVGAIREFYRG